HKISPRHYYRKYVAPHNKCIICGKMIPYRTDLFRSLTQYHCSNACRGKTVRGRNHKSWKGGSITRTGYRMVTIGQYAEKEQVLLRPMTWNVSGQLPEHRAVVAIALGRSLLSHESVHHRNGDRADNRLENLQLFASKHTRGIIAAELKCPHCGKRYDE